MTVPTQVTDGLKEAALSLLDKETEGVVFDVEQIDGHFVKKLRERLRLSQREFSLKYGFSIRTLQKWEANTSVPEGPARAYLQVISEIPTDVSVAFEAAAKRRATRRS